jgi:cation diffusion facilitator family transporter
MNGATGDRARIQSAQRVTLIGAGVNLVLGLAKVLFGWLGHSAALIADGIHSFSDLLSDAMVWFAAHHGGQEADEEHPYGHGRIETLATAGLGLLLVLVALGIAWDASARLFEPERLMVPGTMALVMAAASIAAKEVLFHYTAHVARKLRSNMLRANAWHHRSDAVSSVVVMIGVGGTMAGLPYLDAIAAVIVGVMVGKIGWDLAWGAVRELIDTGLEADRLEAIRRTISRVDGVRDLHMLRTRRMGHDALADVHILVGPKVSVSEGHQIAEEVRWRLIRQIDELSDVTVHIDPEDDEVAPTCDGLPPRGEILARLRDVWHEEAVADRIESVNLHYLAGRVDAEVVLPLELAQTVADARRLADRLKQAARAVQEIRDLDVRFR